VNDIRKRTIQCYASPEVTAKLHVIMATQRRNMSNMVRELIEAEWARLQARTPQPRNLIGDDNADATY
jgi:hypothetical protein